MDVLRENEGKFEIVGGDDRMIWNGVAGGTLVWLVDDFDESVITGLSVYPINREELLPHWLESAADDMEGPWNLSEVGGTDPAAPVSLHVGVSIISTEGMCNEAEGLFAITENDELGFWMSQTDKGCGDATEDVQYQVNEAMYSGTDLLQVSIDGETMTWSDERGPQLVWSR